MVAAICCSYYNTDKKVNQQCVCYLKEVSIMKKLYIVTGANGHLGSTLLRSLEHQDCQVRGLVLPDEAVQNHGNITYFKGDVRDSSTLSPLFENTEGFQVTVFHTAGLIDISKGLTRKMEEINVEGTIRIAEMALKYKVYRFIYVSSVHAIPEKGIKGTLKEIRHFTPASVVGGYAKTKAAATQAVLNLVPLGLNAVVVQPSGILGPYDSSRNHLVQMVSDYRKGRLPACVRGGYDIVDVRDVAQGCLLAAEKGRTGECYILSGKYYDIKSILSLVREIEGGRRLPVLPIWMAEAFAPLFEWISKRRKERPLYTRYSLYTLKSNSKFSHDKATKELGYRPRSLRTTIADTLQWLKAPETAVL